MSENMREFPSNRAIVLRNLTCPYCGCDFAISKSTREHVIGRRFVPKGNLDGSWNLIVNACEPCNQHKATLEDDISAITQYTTVWSGHCDHNDLRSEANRKARSAMSRLTSKPVAESEARVTVRANLAPGLTMTLDLDAPPQIQSERLFELARMQMMAFFYVATFDEVTRKGGFWQGGFYPIFEAQKSNWGNSTHRAFMDIVAEWEPHIRGYAAKDYFVVVIRRHPSAACWSWAIEWNQQYRLIGLFGEQEPSEALLNELPRPKVEVVAQRGEDWFGICPDVPLNNEQDRLFEWPPGAR